MTTLHKPNAFCAGPDNSTMIEKAPPETTSLSHDDWYDGSLKLWQPSDGFRATTDAVLLAAAVPERAKIVLELGAGGGAASLALARRLPHIRVTAAENNPLMAGLLARNAEENGYAEQIEAVEADIFDPALSRSWEGRYDHVFFNPPYNDAASSLSDNTQRRSAMAGTDPARWVGLAATCLKPKGRLVMISRSDRLPEILEGVARAGAGEAVVRPVHSQADQPAIRFLLAARKGIVGPLAMLPPLVLRSGAEDGLSPEMRAISHDRAAIDMAHPARGKPQSRDAGAGAGPGLKTPRDGARKKA